MVPSAGLEPAWVTPYAPQTYVSTNSTTTARGLRLRAGSAGGGSAQRPRAAARRPGPRRAAAGLPAGRSRRGFARRLRGQRLDNGGLGRASRIVSRQREHDESDERARRQLVQERRRAAGAEGRLAPSAAERAGDVRSLPLLEEDHEDQEEADEDVMTTSAM